LPDKEPSQITFKQELLRKLTHIFALVIPGGYYVLGLTRAEMLTIMIPISLAMVLIDIARLKNWRLWHYLRGLISPIIREHEMQGDFTGASYILVTSCFVIALFAKPEAIAALAFIMAGDPAAAIIGRRYGRHRFKTKSVEGSLAFLAAAMIISFIVPDLPLIIGVIGALTATITEAVSFHIDDNTSVPLISGLVMQLLHVGMGI
jgi:dolichol kinase